MLVIAPHVKHAVFNYRRRFNGTLSFVAPFEQACLSIKCVDFVIVRAKIHYSVNYSGGGDDAVASGIVPNQGAIGCVESI